MPFLDLYLLRSDNTFSIRRVHLDSLWPKLLRNKKDRQAYTLMQSPIFEQVPPKSVDTWEEVEASKVEPRLTRWKSMIFTGDNNFSPETYTPLAKKELGEEYQRANKIGQTMAANEASRGDLGSIFSAWGFMLIVAAIVFVVVISGFLVLQLVISRSVEPDPVAGLGSILLGMVAVPGKEKRKRRKEAPEPEIEEEPSEETVEVMQDLTPTILRVGEELETPPPDPLETYLDTDAPDTEPIEPRSRRRKPQIKREHIVIFSEETTYRLSVPVDVLLANLDPRCRFKRNTLTPWGFGGMFGMVAGTFIGYALVAPPVALFMNALAAYVWGALAGILLSFPGMVAGAIYGASSRFSPQTHWLARRTKDGKIEAHIPNVILAMDDKNQMFNDARTGRAIYEVTENNDLKTLFSAGKSTLQKLAIGGIAATLVAVVALLFLIMVVWSDLSQTP